MRLLLMWLILACPAWTQQEPRHGIERGRLLPKVSCLSDGKFSYALYLPKGYAADRAWPVLLAFAPDGDGAGPVMLFQAEAERLGWIVAGSLDSRNGAVEPNLAAQKALWEDLHKRFNIDSRRVVSTGFSGGARMAMRLALDRPGKVFGVLSFGAFYGEGKELAQSTRLCCFLACGDEDFNFLEQREAMRSLKFRGLRPWWEVFPGPHHWPPVEVAARALAVMHLAAAREGLGPLDGSLEAELSDRWFRDGEALVAQGRKLPALRFFENLVAFFPKAGGSAGARQRIKQLAKDKDVRAELEAEEDAQSLAHRIFASREERSYPDLLRELAAASKTRIGHTARLESLILAGERMTLQQMALVAWARKDYRLSAQRFSLLAELAPQLPIPAYQAACAWTQAGDRGQGLSWIRKALDRGFKDRDTLRRDPFLAPLRELPEFAALVNDR